MTRAPFKRTGCGPPPGVRARPDCLTARDVGQDSGSRICRAPANSAGAVLATHQPQCRTILPRPELSIRDDVATLLASSLSFGPYFRFPPNLDVRYSQAK